MPARGFLWCFTERVFGRSLQIVGAIHESPADFAVFLPSVTRFARATSPTSGEVCGTVKTVPYTHEIEFSG